MSAVTPYSEADLAGVRAPTEHQHAHDRCDDDFDFEPVPGLPEALPPGERVLWSGEPKWTAIALDVFHVRALAFYAALIVLWRFAASLHDGVPLLGAAGNALLIAVILGVGIGLMALLAYMTAKTTRYTITNKRVVMRIGIALTMSVNLPFRQVEKVDYRPTPFGTGAIAMTMEASGGLGYVVLWPHVRPLKLSRPQPMLRCVPSGERVARILGHAIVASRGEAATVHVTKRPAAAPGIRVEARPAA